MDAGLTAESNGCQVEGILVLQVHGALNFGNIGRILEILHAVIHYNCSAEILPQLKDIHCSQLESTISSFQNFSPGNLQIQLLQGQPSQMVGRSCNESGDQAGTNTHSPFRCFILYTAGVHRFKAVVVDASKIIDIDASAARELSSIPAAYQKHGTHFLMVSASAQLKDSLSRFELLESLCGEVAYVCVHDAVNELRNN